MNYLGDDKNILLNQISTDQSTFLFKEVTPRFVDSPSNTNFLSINTDGNLTWLPFVAGDGINISISNNSLVIDTSLNLDFSIFDDKRLKGTNIFYDHDSIGVGRVPLHSYKFDIAVPQNTLMTAFHVGDGKWGFSMGNGTEQGFIPEIIGMGSDENDPGLYFLGKTGIDVSSNTPLIVLDGRNYLNNSLTNRPIVGIKSGHSENYHFLVDAQGRSGFGRHPKIYKMEVEGSIQASDFILDSSISFKEIVKIIIEQEKEINELKILVKELIDFIK